MSCASLAVCSDGIARALGGEPRHVMPDEPRRRLSGTELDALKFAARRQLARWSSKPQLTPNQQAQRTALTRAVGVLQDHALIGGCELHAGDHEEHTDV